MSRAMAAGTALIALLLTSACGGGSSASPTPSPSPSPSPSATSTTPTPPALPAAATKNTKAGAIAFVRHYVELINHAQFTGDVTSLTAVSGDECDSCTGIASKAREIYGAGGHISGGAWKAKPIDALPNPAIDGWTIDTRVKYGPQQVVTRKNAEARQLSGGTTIFSFLASYRSGRWVVVDFTRAQ